MSVKNWAFGKQAGQGIIMIFFLAKKGEDEATACYKIYVTAGKIDDMNAMPAEDLEKLMGKASENALGDATKQFLGSIVGSDIEPITPEEFLVREALNDKSWEDERKRDDEELEGDEP